MKLSNLFKKKPDPVHNAEGFSTEYAFTIDGVDYYEFKDKNNLPYLRGLEAITFYQELQNGITTESLKAWVAKMKQYFADPKKINVGEIFKHVGRLEDRLNYVISKDVIYKVASVAFIDKTENPIGYDWAHNARKIEAFRKHGDAFFLSMPLQRLIPFLKTYGEFSLTYLNMVEQADKLMEIAGHLSRLEQELRSESD